MRCGHTFFHGERNQILAKVVAGTAVGQVAGQGLVEVTGIKDIDAHARQGDVGPAGQGFRLRRLLDKLGDLARRIHGHYTAALGIFHRYFGAGHRALRAFLNMVGEHDRIIHFVYMIACQDQNIFRVISLNNVDVLEHRIRSAAIPRIFRHTLLGRQQINMFVQFVLHERPATLQMA